MSVPIGKYRFAGPYYSTNQLEDRSGVYVILDDRADGGYYRIDIGESAQVRTRVETHDRKDCWSQNQRGRLCYAVLYTPNVHQSGRQQIEQELRQQLSWACGER